MEQLLEQNAPVTQAQQTETAAPAAEEPVTGTEEPAAEPQTPPAAPRNPYAAGESAVKAPAKPKEKKHTGWKVLAVLMCVVLCFNTLLDAVSLALQAINLFGSDIFDFEEWFEPNDPAREDDVTIGWEYEIKSTLPISNAYLSGDTAGLSDRELETLDMATAVLDKIITPDMTDAEKEAAVYEWLTTKLESENGFLTVIPPDTDESDNPYGVLKYRSAVCVGYATTFRLFMQMLGIECMVVHDSSLSHSWDLVKLDGEWYHTDCYFDSPEGNYRHFNISDEIRMQEEDWNMDFFPAATGTKYNYAMYNCETLAQLTDFPAWLKAALDESKRTFSCTFADGDENEQAVLYMVEAGVNAAMESGLYGDAWLDHYWAQNGDGEYVACFFYESYESEPGYEVTDDERDQIDRSIEDAFGVTPDWDEIYVEEPTFYEDETVSAVIMG